MRKKTIETLKTMLIQRRRDILKQHLNEKDALSAVPELATGDAADAASSNDLKEMSLNLKESEKRSLEVIEEALSRMEAGTYGQCEDCDILIPEKRLLILPYAKLCVACQEKREKELR